MGRLYFQEEGESGFLHEARDLIWDGYMRGSIMAIIKSNIKYVIQLTLYNTPHRDVLQQFLYNT